METSYYWKAFSQWSSPQGRFSYGLFWYVLVVTSLLFSGSDIWGLMYTSRLLSKSNYLVRLDGDFVMFNYLYSNTI